MKQKLSLLFLLTLFAAIILFKAHSLLNKESILIANIEVLTETENDPWQNCYSYFSSDSTNQDVYCGTCDYLPGRAKNKSICQKK
jgi:hypothetical protein